MALIKKHKRRFQIVTHTLLIISLAMMILAFILQHIESFSEVGDYLIYVGVIIAIASTPIRLLGLSHMYYVQGDKQIALLSSLLVFILALGATVKWFLL